MLLKVIVACLIVLLLSCGEEPTEEEVKVRAEAVGERLVMWAMAAALCEDERAQKAIDEFYEEDFVEHIDKLDFREDAEWEDLSNREKVEVIEAIEYGVDKVEKALEDAECG